MKKLIKGVATTVACFALLTTFNKVRFRYDWPQALKRTIMTPFVGTIWASGFSEGQFAKVRLGMSQEDVKALLGAPIRDWCSGTSCAWLYSWQDTTTADYDRRWVAFDSRGQVIEVRHVEFHVD